MKFAESFLESFREHLLPSPNRPDSSSAVPHQLFNETLCENAIENFFNFLIIIQPRHCAAELTDWLAE